jgi:hypothetical protein
MIEYVASWLSFQAMMQLFGGFAVVSFLLYVLPILLAYLAPEQDLKKKYNAEWAFVTGASSGLGRALSFKMGPALSSPIASFQQHRKGSMSSCVLFPTSSWRRRTAPC